MQVDHDCSRREEGRATLANGILYEEKWDTLVLVLLVISSNTCTDLYNRSRGKKTVVITSVLTVNSYLPEKYMFIEVNETHSASS